MTHTGNIKPLQARKIYIAGPMRGYPEFNFPAFFEASEKLQLEGWKVFNPAYNDIKNGVDITGLTGKEESIPNFSLREALAWDLQAICKCDAIYMLEGWLESAGASLEIHLADVLGLEVIYQEES